MKKLLSVLTILFVVAFSASAQTSPQVHPHQKNAADKKQMKKELNLSKEQAQQLKTFRQESKDQAKQIKENKSLSKVQKKEQLRALKQSREQKMKSILTADQQKKVAQWKQSNKNKKHKRDNV